jgi:L-ascorbate metabolism protein UlaG (beta-lactamase superfamily)
VSRFAVTRVTNSCVLLEFDECAVLTDPWFTERWHLHRAEALGLTVDDLPPLTAIIASHPVTNHWDITAFANYRYKDRTRVITSTAHMSRKARAIGFTDVRQLGHGEELTLPGDVRLEAIRDRGPVGTSSNVYVLTRDSLRVLFGGEARNLTTLRSYLIDHPPVDLALLPVNGLHVPGGPRLVMTAHQAVEATAALGADTLIPIHDAHARDPVWAFIRRNGSTEDALRYAQSHHPGVTVVSLPPGVRWERPDDADG